MKRVVVIFVALAVTLTALKVDQPVSAQPPADKERVNQAIARGAAFLKSVQQQSGNWQYQGGDPEKNTGATALAGLALLEAGVDPQGPELSKAIKIVVSAAPGLKETYVISLAIMFIDRYYGENKAGSNTILALAGKLISLQLKDGGWSYGGQGNFHSADNSNTQFAILGLWTARKHRQGGMDGPLMKTEKKFRAAQDKNDGGWGYGLAGPAGDPSTPTMTCAGLLGLFLGFGIQKEKTAVLRATDKADSKDAPAAGAGGPVNINDIRTDRQVIAALDYLGQSVGGNLQGAAHWMYLLWSIERVGVTYKLELINNVNWYNWGANILLRTQGQNGAWMSDHGPVVDTCFAILFLRRTDLVGKIGETRLTSGAEARAPAGGAGKPGGGGAGTPAKPADDSAEALAQKLVDANASTKSQLIDEYRKGSGKKYTMALAIAIPKLPESLRDKARLALDDRMADLSTESLGKLYIKHDSAELRRSAAKAAARGGAKELCPDLIELLKDRDTLVSEAAYEALKSLSGKSLDKDAGTWTNWWKSQGSK